MHFPRTQEFVMPEINHVLVVGQSNGLGGGSTGGLNTRQRYRNRMWRNGVLGGTSSAQDYREMVPLLESTETIATGFSDFVSFKSGGTHAALLTNCCNGATAYSGLAKGTVPYALGTTHVRQGRQRVGGSRFRTRAILCVHGEADAASGTYDVDIRQWQSDYQTDINRLEGAVSTRLIPMFHTQAGYPGFAANDGAILALAEHVANPTKSIMVGPRYFLTYPDGVHFNSASSQRLGEYYGKAYYSQCISGVQWQPLRPSSVVRSGATITITFTGNVGQLVLDTTNVTDPGNFGFSYTDDTATASVIRVVVQGSNQVVVTLNTTPTGANKKVRYGYNGATEAGYNTGKRGCLRDSDPELSPNGNSLVNWCVYFNEAAT